MITHLQHSRFNQMQEELKIKTNNCFHKMIGIINHVDASVLAGFKTLHLKMKPTVRCSGQYFIQLFPPCNSWKMSLLVWP